MRKRSWVLCVIALVVAPGIGAHAGDGFFYGVEDSILVGISDDFITVQFDTTGYRLLGPNWADFFSRHPCLSGTPEPYLLDRGFYVMSLQPECGYSLAAGDLMTDPEVSRVAPTYTDGDSIAYRITDLVIVQFDPVLSWNSVLSLLTAHHCAVVDTSPYTHNLVTVALTDTLLGGPLEIGNDLHELEEAVFGCARLYAPYVEPSIPADSFFQYQWNYLNVGQEGGTPDADLDADSAWEVAMALGDPQLEVALLDNGVTVHEDLPAERITAGIDVVGDSAVNPEVDYDPSPGPYQGHGMATAGMIAASHNDIGIAGLCPNIKIRPVKIYDDRGSGLPYYNPGPLVQAIDYAANSGALIMCLEFSFPGTVTDIPEVSQAIQRAAYTGWRDYTLVIVGVTGNTGSCWDPKYCSVRYPGTLNEVIAVGASTKTNLRATYSSWGGAVEVVAPSSSNYGPGNIWTLDQMDTLGVNPHTWGPTDANGNMNYTSKFGGTSASAAQVAGVAAMILSRRPDFKGPSTLQTVRSVLRGSAVDIGAAGRDADFGWGRVNAYRALLSVIRGDVNNDGTINPADVTQLVNWVYRSWPSAKPKPHVCVGDCNCDGAVNPVDVAVLINHVYKAAPRPGICFNYMQ